MLYNEEESEKRMNVVAQNGNTGNHYNKVMTYNLNPDNIHDLEDIKDILEILKPQITIFNEPNKTQQVLIDKGILNEERDY